MYCPIRPVYRSKPRLCGAHTLRVRHGTPCSEKRRLQHERERTRRCLEREWREACRHPSNLARASFCRAEVAQREIVRSSEVLRGTRMRFRVFDLFCNSFQRIRQLELIVCLLELWYYEMSNFLPGLWDYSGPWTASLQVAL